MSVFGFRIENETASIQPFQSPMPYMDLLDIVHTTDSSSSKKERRHTSSQTSMSTDTSNSGKDIGSTTYISETMALDLCLPTELPRQLVNASKAIRKHMLLCMLKTQKSANTLCHKFDVYLYYTIAKHVCNIKSQPNKSR